MVRNLVQSTGYRLFHAPGGGIRYGIAAGAVSVFSLALFGVRDQLGVLNILLLYLLLCLVLGLTIGARAATLGAALAFVAFDFLFIPPYYTFSIASEDHVLGLFAFLGVAIVTAVLVGNVRKATDEAVRESRRSTLLYQLNRSLVADADLPSLLHTITRSVVEVYGATTCRILMPDASNGDLRVQACWPETASTALDREESMLATYAIEHRQVVELGAAGRTIRLPHGQASPAPFRSRRKPRGVLFVPVSSPRAVLGVLEVTRQPVERPSPTEDETILTSFADQAVLAIERTRLHEEVTRVAVLEQSNDLKSALLAAVSHDLRTPLTAIKASSSALLSPSVTWEESARAELLHTIDEETDRLTLMVANLLDLSRIEGGALRPDRDWQDMAELLHDAVQRTARQTTGHPVTMRIDPQLPVVYLDYVEIMQVMINLIGNAVKYSETGTPITITAIRHAGAVRIGVTDHGRGIAPDDLNRLFDPFFRVSTGGPVSGSGIGLAICKGLIEAHGGTIQVSSHLGVGTTVSFELPVEGVENGVKTA